MNFMQNAKAMLMISVATTQAIPCMSNWVATTTMTGTKSSKVISENVYTWLAAGIWKWQKICICKAEYVHRRWEWWWWRALNGELFTPERWSEHFKAIVRSALRNVCLCGCVLFIQLEPLQQQRKYFVPIPKPHCRLLSVLQVMIPLREVLSGVEQPHALTSLSLRPRATQTQSKSVTTMQSCHTCENIYIYM